MEESSDDLIVVAEGDAESIQVDTMRAVSRCSLTFLTSYMSNKIIFEWMSIKMNVISVVILAALPQQKCIH
jgi:hypothetical protein